MHLSPRPVVVLCLTVVLLFTGKIYGLMLDEIELPPNFHIEVFAEGVTDARQIAVGPPGVIFVGSREAGVVYRVRDDDGDNRADSVEQIARNLYMPSGVAYRNERLYVAEIHRITALENPLARNLSEIKSSVVYEGLPKDAHHGWKAIDFGPDEKLYVPVGAPCNVCEVEAPYGTILAVDLATKKSTVHARGVRNSVGFAWHPITSKLWFSDNGRDWMGDDLPGCEINRVDEPGQHFGFPYVHADGIADDEYVAPQSLNITLPAKVLDAHVAPLGILFYTGEQFAPEYKNRLFVAQHGSWNRTKKAGYNIMIASIDELGNVSAYDLFARGWLKGQAVWGRPVDLAMLADGSLLVSDDHAGVLYRISYRGG